MTGQTTGATVQETPLDLIMVEDSTVDVELESDVLREAGMQISIRRVEDEAALRAALKEQLPDAILSDWTLPRFSGRMAFDIARERCPEIPFIFVSGTISETTAIEAMRQGASDYVFKHQLQQLGPAVARALEEARAARLLRESEKRLAMALQAANQGIYDLNVQTGETIVSPEYALMLGHNSAKFNTTTAAWIERLHPDDRDRVARNFKDYVAGITAEYSEEFRQKTRSGDWLWTHSQGKLTERDAQSRPLRMLGIHTDISKRKQAEAKTLLFVEQLTHANHELKTLNEQLELTRGQLLQSEKMAAIGQLAAGVAHEINNPVGFVKANLGPLEEYLTGLLQLVDAYRLVAKRCPPDDPALYAANRIADRFELDYVRTDSVALIAESKDGLERIRRIVRDLKDFSHVDDAEWKFIDIHACLESTLNVVWNELKYKVTLVKDYSGLPEITCLPSQLSQVFMNILINAAQAISDHGTITLRTGLEANSIWVEIEDTGAGIAPEHLSRIFEPFFTTKPVGSGTGLGMAVSYGIIQKHDGRIDVRSEVGHGTTFRIKLPIHPVTAK